MNKLQAPLIGLVLTFGNLTSYQATANATLPHSIGGSLGLASNRDLTGQRLFYRVPFFYDKRAEVSAEFGYARWNGQHHNLHIVALVPVLRYYSQGLNLKFFVEASVGPAYKSSKSYGNGKVTGSKWTFQDFIGCGLQYHAAEIALHYTHYSNAGLAKPNPGVDVRPVVTFSYRF